MLCAAGCASPDASPDTASMPDDTTRAEAFTPTSAADSLALQVYRAHGGNAWAEAPYLRFDFAIEQGAEEAVVARHLWNRTTGQYRVEWSNEGSDWVALLDLHSEGEQPVGRVFENGEERTGSAAETPLQQAYQRYINDTYWLLAPLKVLDPGVNRMMGEAAVVADSTLGMDAQVLHLTFGDVGLTPGDRYWMHVDPETHRVAGWAFHLQNMPDDAQRRAFDWTNEMAFEHEAGTIHLQARKQSTGGGMAITMPTLRLPQTVDRTLFTSGTPNQLQ